MTNLEVAKCLIGNAIAYGEDGDLETVMVNLKYIEEILDNPNGTNKEYTMSGKDNKSNLTTEIDPNKLKPIEIWPIHFCHIKNLILYAQII